MPNKKTVKRNKVNSKKSRGRNRKGGFFGLFDDKHNTGDAACDPNNLVNLTDSNSMYANYQKCCPKNWYGSKNNSPYCKQLDLNYKAASQKNQMEIASTKQMINTKRFNVNDNNSISVIDCKNPSLYNTEEEIQQYITSCECNKTRYNPFSEKKANCAIIKPKLERLKEQERDTLVTNPIQKNNQYMPVNQNDIQYEQQERDTEVTNPIYLQAAQNPIPPVNAQGDWKQMDYEPEPKDIDTVGGKKNKTRRKSMKRKTKKHFKKRSIRKRKGRKY